MSGNTHLIACLERERSVPYVGRKVYLNLSNHLANVHKLSSEERKSYLIRAKRMSVDIPTVLTELRKLNRLIETLLCSFSSCTPYS